MYNTYTEQMLFDKYGYLMDEEHGKGIGVLVDIIKCNGLSVGRIGKIYFIEISKE